MKKLLKTLVTRCVICWWNKNPDENEVEFEPSKILEQFAVCKKHKEELEKSMKPRNNSSKEMVMEPVPCDEFLWAVISDVKYEEAHAFTGQFARVGEAVRIKFTLDPINGKAFDYPKSSRWMSFNYDQKSNLFKNYIQPLVKNAKPYMDFDILSLKGIRCRLMFEESQNDEGKKFYNIMMVKPEKGKEIDSAPIIQIQEIDDDGNEVNDKEVPF